MSSPSTPDSPRKAFLLPLLPTYNARLDEEKEDGVHAGDVIWQKWRDCGFRRAIQWRHKPAFPDPTINHQCPEIDNSYQENVTGWQHMPGVDFMFGQLYRVNPFSGWYDHELQAEHPWGACQPIGEKKPTDTLSDDTVQKVLITKKEREQERMMIHGRATTTNEGDKWPVLWQPEMEGTPIELNFPAPPGVYTKIESEGDENLSGPPPRYKRADARVIIKNEEFYPHGAFYLEREPYCLPSWLVKHTGRYSRACTSRLRPLVDTPLFVIFTILVLIPFILILLTNPIGLVARPKSRAGIVDSTFEAMSGDISSSVLFSPLFVIRTQTAVATYGLWGTCITQESGDRVTTSCSGVELNPTYKISSQTASLAPDSHEDTFNALMSSYKELSWTTLLLMRLTFVSLLLALITSFLLFSPDLLVILGVFATSVSRLIICGQGKEAFILFRWLIKTLRSYTTLLSHHRPLRLGGFRHNLIRASLMYRRENAFWKGIFDIMYYPENEARPKFGDHRRDDAKDTIFEDADYHRITRDDLWRQYRGDTKWAGMKRVLGKYYEEELGWDVGDHNLTEFFKTRLPNADGTDESDIDEFIGVSDENAKFPEDAKFRSDANVDTDPLLHSPVVRRSGKLEGEPGDAGFITNGWTRTRQRQLVLAREETALGMLRMSDCQALRCWFILFAAIFSVLTCLNLLIIQSKVAAAMKVLPSTEDFDIDMHSQSLWLSVAASTFLIINLSFSFTLRCCLNGRSERIRRCWPFCCKDTPCYSRNAVLTHLMKAAGHAEQARENARNADHFRYSYLGCPNLGIIDLRTQDIRVTRLICAPFTWILIGILELLWRMGMSVADPSIQGIENLFSSAHKLHERQRIVMEWPCYFCKGFGLIPVGIIFVISAVLYFVLRIPVSLARVVAKSIRWLCIERSRRQRRDKVEEKYGETRESGEGG